MQQVLTITDLPDGALEAAKHFYDIWLLKAQAVLAREGSVLAIAFPDAPVDHADWRRAAVRDLARGHAPGARVNAIAGGSANTVALTLAYLGDAPGVTGQYLVLDDTDA